VDACAADHLGQLLFVSVFGRDTSVQQLMARLHQPTSQGGVETLTLIEAHNPKPKLKVLVGDAKRLEKTAGRMPKTGLLGNLVHTWIFDPKLLETDHATRCAWIFEYRKDKDGLREEAWQLIKDLSPVPLLEDWRDQVLVHIESGGHFKWPPSVGVITAIRLELPEDFAQWVSESVREWRLVVPGSEAPTALAA
jgi:hypothetical protein